MTEASERSKYQAPPPSNSWLLSLSSPSLAWSPACPVVQVTSFSVAQLLTDPSPFAVHFFTPCSPALRPFAPFPCASVSTAPPASPVLSPMNPQCPSYPFPTCIPTLFVAPTWAHESIFTPGSLSRFPSFPCRIRVVFEDGHIQSLPLSQACPQQDPKSRAAA